MKEVLRGTMEAVGRAYLAGSRAIREGCMEEELSSMASPHAAQTLKDL